VSRAGRADDRLEGKVALVTGAGRGIGEGVASGLAAAGAAVACLDVDEGSAESTAAQITAAGGRAIAQVADVSRAGDVEDAVERITGELGAIGVLVTCAAIDEAVPLGELDPERWQRMIDVNLTGTFLCVRSVLPGMRALGGGRVILIGSNLAEKGGERLAHYGAAKAGVHGLARSLARELAPEGINVNVVAPGPTDTEMLRSLPADWLEAKRAELPIGRFGRVEEIVPTVLMLASEDGGFYVGATLNVSGGDVIP
jgi:3-oxoacyl-[acyl-carrier protein] reductase